jgi:hypothetical protein
MEKYRQCTYNVTLRHVRATIVAMEKAISITFSESVFVALATQYAMRMRRIVICGVSGCTIFFHFFSLTARFSTPKKVIEHKMCVYIFSTLLPETFLILTIIQRDIIINKHTF